LLTDKQIASLAMKKIVFGHQSVGNDIIDGIRDLTRLDPRLKLNLVKSADPHLVSGSAFVEFELGRNGNPKSKIDAFTAILDKETKTPNEIALFKFCYVDIDSSTDIPKMFAGYRDGISRLKAKHPCLSIVHVTVPLTTVEGAAKAWIKSLLGKVTRRDMNVKRNEFNRLMRQTYAQTDPIFDLEEVESTLGSGLRSYFTRGKEKVYTLAPELARDHGHLNEQGRRLAAERLLVALASA